MCSFRWNEHGLTRLRIAPLSRRPVDQIKAPETAHLNAATFRQRAALRLNNGFDGEIDIFGSELRVALGKPRDERGTGHAHILARSSAPGYSAAELRRATNPELQRLPRPLYRKRLHQVSQRQMCWLSSRKNSLHDVRRQQRKTHHTADKSRADPFPAFAISSRDPKVTFANSRCQRNARAVSFTSVLSIFAHGAGLPSVPSGNTITLRPPRFLTTIAKLKFRSPAAASWAPSIYFF